MNEQIERIMKSLGCTEAEAKQIIADDKAVDRGERMEFDLSPEQEKLAKKMAGTGTRKTSDTPQRRTYKPNETKSDLIEKLNAFLIENGYQEVVIVNKERQIAFKTADNAYEITLVQKRKQKGA